MPAVMLALDAEIHLKGPKGWRIVKASDFFQGLFTVDMAADEIIASVQFVPVRTAAYAKLHQRASHYRHRRRRRGARREAVAASVGAHRPDGRRVACVPPDRTSSRRSRGSRHQRQRSTAAAQSGGARLEDVNADIHASEEYRRAMIPVFTRRALSAAMARR